MTLDEVLSKLKLPFKPLPYQIQDINELAQYDRALLDSCVGSGKTFEATAVALMKEVEAVVVLMPPILTAQWEAWLRQIEAGSVLAYEGSPAKRQAMDLNVHWLVMSNGIFKNDLTRLLKHYNDKRVLLICDESQCVKDATTKIHRSVRDFTLGKELLMMTGTPLSSPADAYGHIKLKTPTVYRSWSQFEMLHVDEVDHFGQVKKWKNLELLSRNFRLNCVYRTKESIAAESPEARIVPIKYKLSSAHMKLYKKLMDEQIYELPNGGKIDVATAVNLYHAAQQIVVNYDYFSGDPDARSNSLDLLDEVCSEIDVGNKESSKLLVWASYKRTNNLLAAYLTKYNGASAYSQVDSKAGVKKFMEDATCRTLNANPASAGAGLNPQRICNHALFLETPTRTILYKQAAGRIDRLGQPYSPITRIGIAVGTIQEALYQNLLDNDSLVNKVLGAKDLKKMIYGDS